MYGAQISTSFQVAVETAEEPRVDRLQLLRVLLLDERLHRCRERRHRHTGEHERAGHVCRADRAAERVRDDDCGDRAAERREGHRPRVTRGRRRRVDDREGRAETGAARDTEQERVAQRIPEDALVRRAGDREHPADERGEHDSRRADHREDGAVGLGRLAYVQAGHMRERPAEDRLEPDVHRPDRKADDERDEEEAFCDEAGAETDAAGLDPRRSLHPLHRYGHYFCRAIFATAAANWTIRGPQRDAMSSFTPTTRRWRPRRSRSTPAARPPSPASGRSTSCRRGR